MRVMRVTSVTSVTPVMPVTRARRVQRGPSVYSRVQRVQSVRSVRSVRKVDRRLYHREWVKKHPGYKTADSRLRALFRPAKRPFFREILGVKARVNLLARTLQNGWVRG